MSLARTAKRTQGKSQNLVRQAELHIHCREHTTESLAQSLGVSFATAARVVDTLRKEVVARGGELVSVRRGRSWHYEIREEERLEKLWKTDPLLKAVGALRGVKRPFGESIDDIVYNGR